MSGGSGNPAGSQQNPNLMFSPTAVEQNGQLQRVLQQAPVLSEGPKRSGPQFQAALSQVGQAVLASPGAMSGNAGGLPITSQDPNVAANQQQLQQYMAGSQQKKAMLIKALTGGG